MSASLINDVGSIIVIGDEPGRKLPSAATDISTSRTPVVKERKPKTSQLFGNRYHRPWPTEDRKLSIRYHGRRWSE